MIFTNQSSQDKELTLPFLLETEKANPLKRELKQLDYFDGLLVEKGQSVERWMLDGMFEQKLSGIACPNVIDEAQQDQILKHWNAYAKSVEESSYSGSASNIAALGGPTHWEPSYTSDNTPGSWERYFKEASSWKELRKHIFDPLGYDPLKLMLAPFFAAYGEENVRLAKHPKFGREMNDCVIRKGLAANHVDNGQWDVGLDIVGHIGAVVAFAASPDTVQRSYRLKPSISMRHGDTKGNYGLSVPEGTEYIDIPSPAGSMNLVEPTNIHCLKGSSKNRITIATHIVKTRAGQILYYA